MILTFKQVFISPIINGVKKHTFREDLKDRWKEDKLIHFTYGPRMKPKKFWQPMPCTGIQAIHITLKKETTRPMFGEAQQRFFILNTVLYCLVFQIEGKLIPADKQDEIIKNDGFNSLEDFINWFFPFVGETGERKKKWAGKIIHWTDLKY